MRKSNIQTLFVLRFSVLSSLLLSSRICLLLSPKDVVLSEGAVDITSEGRLEVLGEQCRSNFCIRYCCVLNRFVARTHTID